MKKLRLFLLILVACVAQASHAYGFTPETEALIRGIMLRVMLIADGRNLSDYQDEMGVVRRYGDQHDYFSVSSTIDGSTTVSDYMENFCESVKRNLPKLDKKLAKGKSIDFEDAVWAALVSQDNDTLAAKYFEVAAKVADTESGKAKMLLSAIGCRYRIYMDKAAAASAINFTIPDDSKSKFELMLIAKKYGMKDIPSETIQQIFKVDKRLMTRAIRSNDIETLKFLGVYDIPEVDSVLAVKEIPERYNGSATLDYMWKCLIKHNMLWPLDYIPYSNLLKKSDVIPADAFKALFLMARRNEDNSLYFKTETDGEPQSYEIIENMEHGNFNNHRYEYLDKFCRRSPVAALAMAIMIQALEKVKSSDSDFDLMEYTSKLLGRNDSEKAKGVEAINNAFGKYFSISTSGAVTFKFKIPSWLYTTSGMDDDTKKRVAMMDELYLSLANWIYSSNIEESKEYNTNAGFPGGREILEKYLDALIVRY